MLKSKNLKMGTSSKAQFTLTVRTVSVFFSKKPARSVKIKTLSMSGLKMATYWSEKMERAA